MKRFLIFLVFIFNIQSFTKADDIREIEIEGISIGDNALDFYSKDELDNNTNFY